MRRIFILLFVSVLSYGMNAQNSYNTSINSPNPYFSPGDTVSLSLTVNTTLSPFNFFQFAFAPLGMVSTSQLIVCSTAQTPNYYAQGTYSVDLIGTSSISYGSYLLFAQASSNSEVDTVGYITFGPALSPPTFSESIVTSATEYCYGESVSLAIDSIPLDSVVLDVPSAFPSGNVLWLPFSNSTQEFQSLQYPTEIGLGYSLQPNRDGLSNASYYINSTNSALVYTQSPKVAAMSTYQGLADSSEFTISYWVNRDSCTAGILFGRADSIGSGSFACYLTDSCTVGFSGVFVNQSFVNVVKSLEANLDTGWNHIIIEKDQSALRLQINGVTKDTEAVLGSLTSPQPLGFVVGAPMSLIPNGPPVAGAYAALDDIGLWSRKLSSSEKSSLRNAATFGFANKHTYSWSTGQLDTAVTFSIVSDTMVKLSVLDDQGVVHEDSVVFLVNNPRIIGADEYCLGDSAVLTVQNMGFLSSFSYVWNTGDSSAVTGYTPNNAQFAWVESKSALTTCYDSLYIDVFSLPNTSISTSMPFNNTGTVLELSTGAQALGTTIYWNTGDTAQSITDYPTQSTWYQTYGVTAKGCTDEDSILIEVDNIWFMVDLFNQKVPNTPHIAGNFNGWTPDSTSLTNLYGSVWGTSIPLVRGDSVSYKFINGNNWQAPHDMTNCSSWPYQNMGNRYAHIAPQTDTVGPYHLSSCDQMPPIELIAADTALACNGDSLTFSMSSTLDSVFWSSGGGGLNYTVPSTYSGALGVVGYYPNGVRILDTIWINQDGPIDTAISISNVGPYCDGDSVLLSVNSSYDIQWSDNDSSSTRLISTTSSLYATLSTLLGCSANTDTVDLVFNANPNASISATAYDICAGDTSVVSVPYGPTNSYVWSNGASGNTVSVTSTAVLFCVITDTVSGCSSQSGVLTVSSAPNPITPEFSGDSLVNVGTKTSYEVIVAQPNVIYNWTLDSLGAINSAVADSTQIRIEWLDPGVTNLKVVADLAGCTSEWSKTITVQAIGIDEREHSFKIFPNPSNGLITIENMSVQEDLILEVYSSNGSLVTSIPVSSDEVVKTIDLSALESGPYLIRTNDGTTYTLIKQ